jgi:glutathione S-transferase
MGKKHVLPLRISSLIFDPPLRFLETWRLFFISTKWGWCGTLAAPRAYVWQKEIYPMPDTQDTLYTMPGTCSLAANIAIAWIDAPVAVENMAYGDHKKDAYLAINPKGKVPAIKFADGDVLTELSAILAWLGATHGGEGYARDSKLGRREAEALSFMTTEVHGAYGPHFAAQNFAKSDSAQDEVKQAAYDRLRGHYKRMNDKLSSADGDWYLGEKSFADAFLYVLVRWLDQTPLTLSDYPALAAHRDRMEADAGVKTALGRQDMQPMGAAS